MIPGIDLRLGVLNIDVMELSLSSEEMMCEGEVVRETRGESMEALRGVNIV
jgi:hypothetical protein